MAYCEAADVTRLMQITFSETSRPTDTDVEAMIADISSEIDGVVQAAGYVVPVSGTAALATLRTYATYGTAVAAWHAGFVSDQLPPRVEYWERTYRDFLSRLRRGEQELPAIFADDADDVDFAVVSMVQRDNFWSVPPA